MKSVNVRTVCVMRGPTEGIRRGLIVKDQYYIDLLVYNGKKLLDEVTLEKGTKSYIEKLWKATKILPSIT